jgi:hypothetical protein
MLSLGHVLGSWFIRYGRERAGEDDVQAVTAEGLHENGARTWTVSPELDNIHAPTEYPLVLVEWHDAWFDADQSGPEDCRADYLVRTVGFLVGEGPRFLSIAHEVLPDDDGFRAVTHIPLAIVQAVTYLSAQAS